MADSFIVYYDGNEAIVCTSRTEPDAIKEWFTDAGREIEDFDRKVINESGVGFFTSIVCVS